MGEAAGTRGTGGIVLNEDNRASKFLLINGRLKRAGHQNTTGDFLELIVIADII